MNKYNKENFYVTTAIDYASGSPHIGHAYEKIGTDIIARWNRKIGKNTFFLTGTDEHGQKIVEKAKEKNISPQEFVNIESQKFIKLTKILNLSNDDFIRTTNIEHKKFIQKMLQKSFDNGDIYLAEYEGLYCVGCEKYYSKDDLIDGKICPDHNKEVESVKEENYFFRLSKYQDKLLKLYENNPEFISPKHRQSEIINRVKEGLQDISISRNKKKLEWGIEFPFDKNHVTYVWFDALFNYLSAVENKDFWPANIHIIGKDIMWFHMVYWPAFLLSTQNELPGKVHAHGHILDEKGHKMSKSLNNVIDPFEQIKKFGLDEFRYYLMALGSFGEDLSYSEKMFTEKINNELNNDLGNLISRVHTMTNKYFNGIIPEGKNLTEIDNNFIKKLNIFKEFNKLMQKLEYSKALNLLFTSIRETNAYINQVQPWKEENQEKLGTIINILISTSILFGKYLTPFMPEKMKLLFKQFNLKDNNNFEFKFVEKGIKINEKENLFQKIKIEKSEKKIKKNNEEIKEGFSKLNLKVGQISEIKKHQDSDKLYIIQVDFGNEKKQIISGLQKLYKLEELKNKKVIVIYNLKPAKLAGLESNGMILACENNKGEVGLLTTDLEIGTNLKCGDEIANNEKIINSKQFKKIKMFGVKNGVEFENKKINEIRIDKEIIGFVC